MMTLFTIILFIKFYAPGQGSKMVIVFHVFNNFLVSIYKSLYGETGCVIKGCDGNDGDRDGDDDNDGVDDDGDVDVDNAGDDDSDGDDDGDDDDCISCI